MSKLYSVVNHEDDTEAYVVQADHTQMFHVIFKDTSVNEILPCISKFHTYEDAVKYANKIANILPAEQVNIETNLFTN